MNNFINSFTKVLSSDEGFKKKYEDKKVVNIFAKIKSAKKILEYVNLKGFHKLFYL